MKITRNGVDYELTGTEMWLAYTEVKADCLKEDILSKAEDMEIELSDESIDRIANRVDKCIGNNDSYWDSYWMTIEYVLKEIKGEN